MFTHRGIAVDSWVMMEDECAVSCDMIGDQAQFTFGHGSGSLHVVATEEALAKLVRVATESLDRLRAIPDGEEVCFTVTADEACGAV
jgi:hypothetical protein